MVEELLERQIDAIDQTELTMRHGEGDGQSRQNEHEQNQRGGQCDGARELMARILHVIGMHGVDFHARISQHVGDDEHDRCDAGPRRQQSGGVHGSVHRLADAQPDRAEHDQQQRGEQGTDQSGDRADLGEEIAATQSHHRADPIQHDDHCGNVHAVIAQIAGTEHIRKAHRDEGDLNWIPHHVLNPLQPDGKKAETVTERLAHPHIHTAFPSGSQFGGDQCGRHQEEHGRNQIQQYGCQTIIGHGRQRT